MNETELRIDLRDESNNVKDLSRRFFKKYDFKFLWSHLVPQDQIFLKKTMKLPFFGSNIVIRLIW